MTGKLASLVHGQKAPRTLELNRVGQSAWLDFISACLIQSGEMRAMVEEGIITGMTSNPTIFAKAIGSGECGYEETVRNLRQEGKNTFQIYDEITRRDITDAADILRPVYDRTQGADGYVSLEASPELAYEEDATVSEALRLFQAVNRPNVMIKVPATEEGIPAFRRLLAYGVNVNVTLIFSPVYYRKIAHAYLDGIRDFVAAGGDPSRVASVASFFVSRVDTAIDKQLDQMKNSGLISEETHRKLRGAMATANARLVLSGLQKISWIRLNSRNSSVAERVRKGCCGQARAPKILRIRT